MSILRDLKICKPEAAAFAVVGIYWGGFAALVPDLKPQAGLSDGDFGLALLVATVGAVLAMWLAPTAEARLGRRALPVLSAVLGLAFLSPGLALGWTGFALAMFVASAASGTLDVVMNARVSGREAETGRSLMNLAHAVFSFAYAGAAILTGVFREIGLAPLLIFAVLGGLTFVLIVLMRGARAEELPAQGGPAMRLPLALIWPAGAIILIGFMSEQATEGWSALHLERGHGAGAIAGALGPTILGLTMGLGRLSGQAMAQRFDELRVITAGALLSASGAALAAFAPGIMLAYAGFAILGLGVSVVAPMGFALAGRVVDPSLRARAISRVAVIGYAGFFIGPPLMGFVSELASLRASFAMIAGCLLAIPLILVPVLARRVCAV